MIKNKMMSYEETLEYIREWEERSRRGKKEEIARKVMGLPNPFDVIRQELKASANNPR